MESGFESLDRAHNIGPSPVQENCNISSIPISGGQVTDEDMKRILKMCKETGVMALIEASPEDVKTKVDDGYRMILLGWDFELLERELRETVKKMRSTLR